MKRGHTKIAIRGSIKNGHKIIKYLESLGGINIYDAKGINKDYYYYIDERNGINSSGGNIKGLKYLLEVPEEQIYEVW